MTNSLFTKQYYLNSQGFRRSLSFYNIITLWKYFKNFFEARRILKKHKPDIVVGMGGYISGAVIKAALSLKIKTAIHEQNSVYGLTNSYLRKKVDLILLAYDIEQNQKTKLVGNPRISDIYRRYKNQIVDSKENIVLVVGGSQGAEKINNLIIELKESFKQKNIKIVLITGQKYYRKNLTKLSKIKSNNFIIKPFVKDLSPYLLDARVVVTRCGATTISEIMALRKVCLFIPSPNVTNNHQEKNALEVVEKEGALMIRENELSKENLFQTIVRLLGDNELRQRIIKNLILISDVNADLKFIKELDELMSLG